MLFAGFFLIVSTYWFAKKYYDQKIAILAIILLAFDNVFFVSCRTVRADIFVAFFATTAFYLFFHGLHSKSLRHFVLSGISMGIALWTHPNSVLILMPILLIFLYRYRWSIIRSKEFWAFLLSSSLAFAPYALYVIKEDYMRNFSHFFSQLGTRADYSDRNYLKDFLREYLRYRHYIFFPKRILIFLVQLVALLYGAFSKRKTDRYLVFTTVAYLFLLPFLNPCGSSRSFIIIIPLVSILVSGV